MLRIAHRLAAHGRFDKIIEHMHVVVCDNVESMLTGEALSSAGHIAIKSIDQFLGIVPPWQLTLFEFIASQRLIGDFPVSRPRCQQGAVLVERQDLRDYAQDDETKNLTKRIPDARYFLSLFFFNVIDGVLRFPYNGESCVVVNSDGKLLSRALTGPDEMRLLVDFFSVVAFFSMSLLNCKNVKTVDSTTDDSPPAKWQRRMRSPDIRYSRIVIDGFAAEARKQGGGIEGVQKAWHICRGSFAEYTPEAPLFGKHVGRFWRPQHVKGKKELGEVRSTHEIKTLIR